MKKKYQNLYIEVQSLFEQDVVTASGKEPLYDNWFDEKDAPTWW
jgi:hypothetical protein